MIEPKEIELNGKKFILSKIPVIPGRQIFTQYLPTAAPKIGDYKANEELMLKLISYVAVKVTDTEQVRLSTVDVINSHVRDWEMLMRLEAAMIEYNCSFFRDGRASDFLAGIVQKALPWITKMLTDSSGPLSQVIKPLSTN